MAGCSPVASIGFAQASKQVCESLQVPHLEKTDLLSASWVMAGAYTPPRPYPSAKTTEYQLSGHCIVKLDAHPSADSDIRVELWLPEGSSWNGRFLGTGNGGYSSNLSYDQMAEAMARWLCRRRLRHRASGGRLVLRSRAPGEDQGLGIPQHACVGTGRQRNGLRLLWPSGGTRLFQRMFNRGTAGAQRGAEVSG